MIIPLLLAGIRCSICRQSPSSISQPRPLQVARLGAPRGPR
ncbi:hypothetical protein Agau_L100542 [Agrobacterium tumefaciens F2]|nr:hypothetical protein Agau_L100542 [Agrobacterium tumefaciens F2]